MTDAESSLETGEGAAVRRRKRSAFDREKIDDFCSRGILGCVLAMLAFAPIAFGATRMREFSILAGIEIIALVLWLVRIWVRDSYRMLFPPLAWGVIAFTSYAIFRYRSAEVEYLARIELFQIVTYALFFFLVLDNCQRQENMQWLLFIPIIAGVLITFYAVFQYATEHRYILNVDKPPMYKGRASGTYICPNHLAGYLEMLLPIAIAFVFSGRIKHIAKILLGYSALVMLAGVVLTFSRAGWISAIFGILVLLAIIAKNRDFRIPALLLLGLLIGGMIFGGAKLATAKRLPTIGFSETRILLWRPAVQMWQENFWTGVGPNHYDLHFRPMRHWQVQNRPIFTHNDYLNLLADYGTIGGILVLLCLAAAAWSLWRTWKFVHRQNDIGSKSSNRSAIVLGVICGLTALLVHSAFDFNMHVPANALLAVLLLAILTIHIRFGTERFWFKPGILGRVLATSVVLGGVVWMSMQAWAMGRESHYLLRAEDFGMGPGQLQSWQKAYRINPVNSETAVRIGEYIRQWGFEGDDGYQEKLQIALKWFDKARALNPRDPYPLIYSGMCWHWLGDASKAAALMEQGLALDPRNYFIMTLYGWHHLQIGDLEEARIWFKNSLAYSLGKYSMARSYLEIVERRLAEDTQTR